MLCFMAKAQHASQKAKSASDRRQEKQRFFRRAAFMLDCGTLIVITYGKGNDINQDQIKNQIAHNGCYYNTLLCKLKRSFLWTTTR